MLGQAVADHEHGFVRGEAVRDHQRRGLVVQHSPRLVIDMEGQGVLPDIAGDVVGLVGRGTRHGELPCKSVPRVTDPANMIPFGVQAHLGVVDIDGPPNRTIDPVGEISHEPFAQPHRRSTIGDIGRGDIAPGCQYRHAVAPGKIVGDADPGCIRGHGKGPPGADRPAVVIEQLRYVAEITVENEDTRRGGSAREAETVDRSAGHRDVVAHAPAVIGVVEET